jgi:hypothetical protein
MSNNPYENVHDNAKKADAKRYAEVKTYLESVTSIEIPGFTVADLRQAILVTIRQDRRGEEPGHYAFPGVSPEELADYATINILRKFEEKSQS